MTTREKILSAVKANQPTAAPLPEFTTFPPSTDDLKEQFISVLTNIGGRAAPADGLQQVAGLLPHFDTNARILTNIPELQPAAELISPDINPHSFSNCELMIMQAHFGVAENGAVWITESLMGQRILPFIPQHLAVVIREENIVPTMQHAYQRIGNERYRFGSFIAGPSKTADIEQALVLGAHGPRTMTVFIINN